MAVHTLVRDELRDVAPYEVPRHVVPVKLDANESPYPLPAELGEALGKWLAEVPLNRYPDPRAAELRGLFASDLGVAPDQLVFGNGSDEFIGLLVQAFAKPRRGETRARVAIPVPSFSLFRIASLAAGALPLEFSLRDDFSLDAAALDRVLTGGKPNLLFLARPNNPTGTLWEREAIEKIADRHQDVLVVVDEAYGEYAGETMLDALGRYANLVVMRSMSKVGLAGIRLGVLVARAEVAREIEKVRMPFNVNALTQRAAAFLLGTHRDRLRERTDAIIAERERLIDELGQRAGIAVFPSRANFVLLRVADAARMWRLLLDQGVLVRRFAAPAVLTNCLRVTVGTPEENAAFLTALDQALPQITSAPAAPDDGAATERDTEFASGSDADDAET